MNIKVTVNHKLTVNGKEYGSLDEMPEELRRAYERAVGGDQGVAGLAQRAARIVFRGNEYGSPADMPEDVRRLYELARVAAKLEEAPPADAVSAAQPARVVERNKVFVSGSRVETDVPAADQPRTYSIELKIGRNGLILLLAVLLLIVWLAR